MRTDAAALARRNSAGLRGAALIAVLLILMTPVAALAHPLGNFSINQFSGLRVHADHVEILYVIDMAEIPTFQEMQAADMPARSQDPATERYVARQVEALRQGLVLEVAARRVTLQPEDARVTFVPGAGDLPTMRLSIAYRAPLDRRALEWPGVLRYRNLNHEGRAGWKEIVASPGSGIGFQASSVPEESRSRQLTQYPSDLLSDAPQDTAAWVQVALIAAPGGAGGSVKPAPAPRGT